MSCFDCKELLKETNRKPDCEACGRIELLKENYLVYTLIERYSALFVDGNGGINIQGIKEILELECIPKDEYKLYIRLIIHYINSYQRTKAEINKNRKQIK